MSEPVDSIRLFTTEETILNAPDFSSSDDPGGTWTQKRAPAEPVPVQRPYCAV